MESTIIHLSNAYLALCKLRMGSVARGNLREAMAMVRDQLAEERGAEPETVQTQFEQAAQLTK